MIKAIWTTARAFEEDLACNPEYEDYDGENQKGINHRFVTPPGG